MKLSRKVISVLIAALLAFTLVLPAVSASTKDTLKEIVEEHRLTATQDQEDVITSIEEDYALIKAKGIDEAPWADAASALLTDEIKVNTKFKNVIILESLMGKTLSAEGVSDETAAKITELSEALKNVYEVYDFTNTSIEGAASKFDDLSAEMSAIFDKYTTLLEKIAEEGKTLKADGEDYVPLTDDEIYGIMAEKLVDIVKSFNAVLFSSKTTYEAAIDNMFSDANIKTLGLVFGHGMADILKKGGAEEAVLDYLKSSEILTALVKNGTELLNGTPEEAVDAFYTVMKTAVSDIFALAPFEGVEEVIAGAGLTAGGFIDVCAEAADAADPDYLSRIININMLFGKYLAVTNNGKVEEDEIVVHASLPDADEFDVCVLKDKYSASIINLIDPIVYTLAGTESKDVIASADKGELVFTVSAKKTGEFVLTIYRSGGTADVYGYLGEFDVTVDNNVPVSSVSIRSTGTITMTVGDKKTISYRVLPATATNQKVTWESDNPSVATVSETGQITAKAKGKAVITVTTDDGGYTASVDITVNKKTTTNTGSGGSGGGGGTTVISTPASDTSTSTEQTRKTFNDMAGHWADADIEELYNLDIVTGYGDGTGNFSPDLNITRAEFAVIITRMMKLSPETDGVVYKDTVNHWSRDYVSTATKYGLMVGFDDGTFGPDLPITREQAVSVIIRAKYFGGTVVNDGGEVLTGDAIIEKIKKDNGIEIKDSGVADIDTASAWARPYINLAVQNGWLKGYDGNVVKPLNNATRAEAAVMAKRVLM